MNVSTACKKNWEPYLCDWWQNTYCRRIVRYKRHFWFVKCVPHNAQAGSREKLAYLLGRNWLNIAEVRCLNHSELEEIQSAVELPSAASPENTYLVRLGFDYSWLFLPIKSVDYAVAAELVFSLWIRRRDAHSFNRIHVRGVPVFFDHLTGLLGEPELIDLERFFSRGPNAGYAGWWQLKEVESSHTLDTLHLRREEKLSFDKNLGTARVLHHIRRGAHIRSLLGRAVQRIQSIPVSSLDAAALQAGFVYAEAKQITFFLEKTRAELDASIERLSAMFSLDN